MKILIAAVALTAAMSSGALAQRLDSMTLANQLGDVLASEELCGLSYDHDAIERFIEERVAADDMSFTPMLRMMTDGATYTQDEMSESAKRAHCAQIRRVARSYGFTAE
ncbi:MAG: signal recognition particle [Salinarimonadaceae bacterium]|nr:MAG: signal recognition particle [Salinarimonadaceae bacterium]